MKKGLLIVAAVLMLASVAQSGDVKLDKWPCTFVPQKLFVIGVYMDVGYYVKVVDQNKKITLKQSTDSHTTYCGSVVFSVSSNFDATLSASTNLNIGQGGALVPPVTSSTKVTNFSITPTAIPALTVTPVTVNLCLTNLDMSLLVPTNGVHVADVTVNIVPTIAFPCVGA